MTRGIGLLTSSLLAIALFCWTLLAAAQPVTAVAVAASDPASAEALFESGRTAMAEGKLPEACSRFLESYRLDPAAGTLLNLAVCEERREQFAAAWQRYRHLQEVLPADDERRGFVAERLEVVERHLARVTLRLPSDAPASMEVRRGGVVLTPASFGAPLPFDPGKLVFEVVAADHQPRTIEVFVRPGERLELVVTPGPVLAPAPPEPRAPSPAAPTATVKRVDRAAPVRRSAPEARASSRRSVGYAVLGTGAAAIVASLVLGYTVVRDSQTLDSNCQRVGPELQCTDEGLAARDHGKAFATAANISFAAGAALSGLGVYLVLSGAEAAAPRSALVGTRMAW